MFLHTSPPAPPTPAVTSHHITTTPCLALPCSHRYCHLTTTSITSRAHHTGSVTGPRSFLSGIGRSNWKSIDYIVSALAGIECQQLPAKISSSCDDAEAVVAFLLVYQKGQHKKMAVNTSLAK
ncbi:hypothetical protein E2C01_014130 [Portunus trituberculatus]|uniref:Uncharacterized protein n=1 Tax=Portunus trituberculatus TaxID=210409 RepID=A0A5B7DJ24_PORTR|nr:hypothetical protein [Portunus trituberculatus]